MASNHPISFSDVNRDVLRTMFRLSPLYVLAVLVTGGLVAWGGYAWSVQIDYGMGMSGKRHPAMWFLYIGTFVFWIGVSHAGTLLSAILHLLKVKWRKPLYRIAEAMTSISLLCAAIYPLIHLGRVWKFYWLLPYPNQRELWPNYRSPLAWDTVAVSSYLVGSSIFLYFGMIPDLAIVRDNSKGIKRTIYGILALGWKGTNREWYVFQKAYTIYACFLTAIVPTVHGIVSWDFAMSIQPGWHSTVFAPYFVSGAIFSGVAFVITLLILMRKFFKLKHLVTDDHMDKLALLMFGIYLIWFYLSLMEVLPEWFAGDPFHKNVLESRFWGPASQHFWVMFVTAGILPLFLISRRFRRSMPFLFVSSILINLGMWAERVMIVISTTRSFIPASWGDIQATWVDSSIVIGTFAMFGFLMLIFCKLFPSVSMYEVKEEIHESE
ncbi:MAG: polysulfide reductase NrfD [Nitrospirae bacterium]|nr:polysulfide reductase NrfD [Nitrospirota bacterium]